MYVDCGDYEMGDWWMEVVCCGFWIYVCVGLGYGFYWMFCDRFVDVMKFVCYFFIVVYLEMIIDFVILCWVVFGIMLFFVGFLVSVFGFDEFFN